MLARSSRALARLARGVMAATKAPRTAGRDLDAQALRSRTWSRKTSAAWTCGMCASPNVAVAQLQNASLPRETVPDGQGVMQDMAYPVVDYKRNQVGVATLLGEIFDVPLRRDIVFRVVRWQLAKRRGGNHKTKTRGEVSGSNRKMYRQKGTGRARHSTAKAPQFRGGGKAHGPVVRSHAHNLQKKVRRLGLKVALSAKAAEGRLLVINNLALPEYKTKSLLENLSALLPDAQRNSVLFVDVAGPGVCSGVGEEVDVGIRRALRNVPGVDAIPVQGLNVYDILRKDTLVITEDALGAIEKRLLVE